MTPSIFHAIRFFCLLAVAVSINGCVGYVNEFTPDHEPSFTSKGYVYGSFLVNRKGHSMGIRFVNSNTGADYLVALRTEDPVYAVEVTPGWYEAVEVTFATDAGSTKGNKPVPQDVFPQPFYVGAGKAVYVGDYQGEVSITSSGNYINSRWSMQRPRNRYVKTTKEFLLYYTAFDPQQTENVFNNSTR